VCVMYTFIVTVTSKHALKTLAFGVAHFKVSKDET
jgi:hypothetical protein